MSRYHSYINTAITITDQYRGQEPLSIYLKHFFAANKKYGGKDRKQIGSLCYHYYRVAHALPGMQKDEALLAATLLCEHSYSEMLQQLKPDWNNIVSQPLAEKAAALGSVFVQEDIFPFGNALTVNIELPAFAKSFLQQPDFFIRLRPGHENVVLAKLTALSVHFKQINKNCLALANGTKLDEEILLDKEVVVQDYNSQQVGEVISPLLTATSLPLTVWDCCAASGGKTIMIHDINKKIRFTVSDIRSSILHNLQNRFQRAGLQQYQSFVANLASEEAPLSATQKFNLVVADVPCTGSGTWARTPEQLFFFNPHAISEFALRQQKIVGNVIPHILIGGYLVYITCSVFKKENEDIVAFIQEHSTLQLVEMKLLKGYEMQADTMFVAIFKNG